MGVFEPGTGKPGNINIQANSLSLSARASIEVATQSEIGETDPTKGLIELPESVGDASDQISQNPCEQGVGSKFISTRRGGLPPSPTETLSSREVWKDVQLPTQLTQNSANAVNHSNTTPERIVEATGWIINEEGIVELVAEKSSDPRQGSCR